MKFKVTYPSGVTEEVTADDTLDGFINQHFGSTWEAAQESGAAVEVIESETAPADEVSAAEAEAPAQVANSRQKSASSAKTAKKSAKK